MSYARVNRAAVYAGAAYPGVALVRRAAPVAVTKLLLVGDRVSSLIVPPFRAICRDHKCELHTYIGDDWNAKIMSLMQQLNPDAVVVVTPEGRCNGVPTMGKFVLQICGASMTASSLAAAAAQAWHIVQQRVRPATAGVSNG